MLNVCCNTNCHTLVSVLWLITTFDVVMPSQNIINALCSLNKAYVYMLPTLSDNCGLNFTKVVKMTVLEQTVQS